MICPAAAVTVTVMGLPIKANGGGFIGTYAMGFRILILAAKSGTICQIALDRHRPLDMLI